MKINMPITNHEVMFDDHDFMLTKTDLRGVISFANADFIKTSGYSEAELIGSPHNIVRHPDMPEEAFDDMWRDIKAGKPWTGMVKNRTKNGDFYWVEANAAPMFSNGQITGFLSARSKPTRQQVDVADRAYRKFKDGKAGGLKIIHGKVVQNNLAYKIISFANSFKVSQRLMALNLATIVTAAMLTAFGLYGLSHTKDSLQSVVENRMIPAISLGKISSLMLDNRTQLRIALSEVSINTSDKNATLLMNPELAIKSANAIEHNIEEIGGIWKSYTSSDLAPDEKVLVDKFAETRGKFVKEALKPAVAALRAGNYDETKAMSVKARELYAAAGPSLEALLKYQTDTSDAEYQATIQRYEQTRLISLSALGAAIMLILWLGYVVTRSIARPLERSIEVFTAISSGDLNSNIDVPCNDEVSQVLAGLKIMQTMLNVNGHAEKALAQQVLEQSTQYENQLTAISNSTGVIEFNMDGTVITANDIFLNVLGYSKAEISGQHHGAFVADSYRSSLEFKAFWEKLNRGESIAGEFQRFGKNGKEIWLQASYNPILDATGKAYKVVKYATDITEQKIKNADYEGQILAIGKSQGVIEMGLDGVVLKTNEAFLHMLGYSLQDLVGKHVSIIMDSVFAKSDVYRTLWDRLINGGNDSGQYKFIHKSGQEVWIQTSYNPIFDLNGKPYKIVNYTMDITAQKLQAADNAGQLAAIDKIQGVVEFDLTGKITAANANFGSVTGYSEKEIIGNHHSMFVEPAYRSSHEYKAFWDKLAHGEAEIGQFKRMAKGGKEIWLQASYNPIMDINGKPFKVVKYATDITEQHKSASALSEAVEETQAIIENAKDGDLSSRVSLEGKVGAIASLCDGVNALMDQMTEVIVQVRESSETINTAAGEIASGNNDLSSRTEQQASSLEETAASMEQLASTVKNNAENAKQANQLSMAASDVAIRGGKVVAEVVDTMSAINSSSKKIEDIISVIDGIAFQTNILALNAAVEAARAGEQGRGFAVVAGEVRNLAQRSASAAKEIKELITDSVSKTAEGTKQVETAGSTMHEIVTSVKRVSDIVAEITAASVEQSAGIDQVNQAVTSMDEVTQQNAALVEEAAAAAESLVDQAVSLTEVVSAFRLNRGNANAAGQSSNRASASRPVTRSVVKASANPVAKTSQRKAITHNGANEGDWEEF